MSARALSALGLAGALVCLAAACASTPEPSTTTANEGPLSGTYSADSLAGTSPFVAITFLDGSHYTYVARSCVVADADGSAADGDPGEADDGASADPTDDGCIHAGAYTLSDAGLTLTDDGAKKSITVPVARLEPDGTEVAQTKSTDLKVAALPGAGSLIEGNGALLGGAATVGQFSAAGTDLRRTGSNGASTSGALLTDQAVALASQWVEVKMPYCQAANGAPEQGRDCVKLHGKTCNRTGAADNAAWNAYRSDCSGLVSFAWSLPAPGLTTPGFVPGAAKYIPMKDLAPGDALLRRKTHIVLFKEWKDKEAGEATVIAEPGCAVKDGPFAQEQSWSFGKAPGAKTSATVKGGTYYAIRKK